MNFRLALSSFLLNVHISPSVSRWLESGLYCIQLTLAYWLMLIAMTYNTYLTAMVVFGAGFGHWLFAGLDVKFLLPKLINNTTSASGQARTVIERTDDFATDACH
jgi:Ctr copper transporter family